MILPAICVAAGGCSGGDDPVPRIGAHSGGDNGGSVTNGGTSGGATHDSGVDSAPSYRDPKAGDAECVAPNMVCGTACVALSSDVGHCGSCDNKCVGDTAQCIGGHCACDPGYDYCANVGCMNVATDVNNCGSCGNVCDPNQFDACVGGQCTLM